MKKLDPITQKISKHFSIHPSRQKTLASMIFGLLCSKNVHHQSLACYLESPNPKSGLRRVERFFFVKTLSLPKNTPKLSLSSLDLKKNLIFA